MEKLVKEIYEKNLTNKRISCIIPFVVLMGYRQMVRQRTLTPSFQGSNPCSPVRKRNLVGFRFFVYFMQIDRSLTVLSGQEPKNAL